MGATPTAVGDVPTAYTDCHPHESALYCVGPDGEDVSAKPADHGEDDAGHNDDATPDMQCHFHAGVEHCTGTGTGPEVTSSERSCETHDRDYDVPLRIGLLFVMLATSSLGVFGPILLANFLRSYKYIPLVTLVLRQIGTGVIIATALIHLYTHAQLMFTNPCLEGIEFEGTTSAIVMAGLFVSFLVDFLIQRAAQAESAKSAKSKARLRTATTNILVLEAGIIFHSILLGITLVVVDDGFFLTLFIIIVFHQFFEGIALGSLIGSIGFRDLETHENSSAELSQPHLHDLEAKDIHSSAPANPSSSPGTDGEEVYLSLIKKCLMGVPFALITPIGMAIGIGVLNRFNGNDSGTVLTMGVLDAISVGILLWIGLVEMLAKDWMLGSSVLMRSGWKIVSLAVLGLVTGMVLMGFLAKWA